ncbi:MAG: hypothetical protein QGF00_12430 [Planctomycetota bacterium]|jgi:hypothetical protein|nr:hypothetical protein [Planctomycetota bacterium]MDP7250402.1 hypothetical protein [Planctomycetota bacterium]
MTTAYSSSVSKSYEAKASRLSLLVILVAPVLAEEESKPKPIIKAQVTAPFNCPDRVGEAYLPIILRVENSGDGVQVRVHAYMDANRRTVKDLALPAGANKRVPLYVPIHRGRQLRVELLLEGKRIWSQEKKFLRKLRTTPFAGTLPSRMSKEGGKYYLDKGETLEIKPLDASDLPAYWRAYGPVRDVILHGPCELSQARQSALAQWVDRGGNLILFAGWKWTLKGPVADLLPLENEQTNLWEMEDESWHNLYFNLVRRLGYFYDQGNILPRAHLPNALRKDVLEGLTDPLYRRENIPATRPLRVRVGTPPEGARDFPKFSDGFFRSPIAVYRKVGSGRVVRALFDFNEKPFEGIVDPGLLIFNFLREVRYIEATEKKLQLSHSLSPQQARVMGDLTAEYRNVWVPGFQTIALWLAIYFAVVIPGDFLLSRVYRKRALTWVTFPLIALTFTLVAFGWAWRLKGQDTLVSQWTVFFSAGDRLAAETYFSLFSPEQKDYDIEFMRPQAHLASLDRSIGARLQTFEVEQPSVPRIRKVQIVAQAIQETEVINPAGPISGRLASAPNNLWFPTGAGPQDPANVEIQGQPNAEAARASGPLSIEHQSDRIRIHDWRVNQWQARLLRARWTPEKMDIKGAVHLSSGEIRVKIENRLGFRLKQAYLVTSAWVASLGQIPDGDTELSISPEDCRGPLVQATSQLFPNPKSSDAFFARVLENSLRRRRYGVSLWMAPILIGWGESEAAEINVLDTPVARSSGYTVINLTCELHIDGMLKRLPRGFLTRESVVNSDPPAADRSINARTSKDILNFKIPKWSSGKIKDVSLVARYRQLRKSYIGSTSLAPGLSYVSRPAVYFSIRDSGSGKWTTHRPSWSRLSKTTGRKQIVYKGRSFENSRQGLRQLVAGLVLNTSSPFRRPQWEFPPDSGTFNVQKVDPVNHTDLLTKAERNGPPEADQRLLNLLPAF